MTNQPPARTPCLTTSWGLQRHRWFETDAQFSCSVLTAALLFWSGCSLLQPLQKFPVDKFGHFEYAAAAVESAGIVVGVPHGNSEPAAAAYGAWIREQTGAGLVIAHDVAPKRIRVSEPLIDQQTWQLTGSSNTGTVYPQFRNLLQATAQGPIKLYLGLRIVDAPAKTPSIEVVGAGFTVEQLIELKAAYDAIRAKFISTAEQVPALAMVLSSADEISWNSHGVRNHGVLMLAERGLILRLPQVLAAAPNLMVYGEVFAAWLREVSAIAANRPPLPAYSVQRTTYGRIDSIAARRRARGIVIGAPHGSFDWYTGELVDALSYRTGLAAVIVRGHTPTECDGWRINVNRPSERRYPTDDANDRTTQRSREVFRAYSQTVSNVARGSLRLYIEFHQSSIDHIDVATVNITEPQAQEIKRLYGEIRDRALRTNPLIEKVKLLIEPIDTVEIGAWAAKNGGVLGSAAVGLHIELPAHHVFRNPQTKRVYTAVLAELIEGIVARHGRSKNRLHDNALAASSPPVNLR